MEGRPKYCPNCGAYLDGSPKFCPNCGGHVPDTSSTESAAYSQQTYSQQQSYGYNQQQQPYGQQPYYQQQPYNQQPNGYNGQPIYNSPPNNKSDGMVAMGVITIILAVLAFMVAIMDFIIADPSSNSYDDQYYRNIFAGVGALYMILGVSGLIGGIVCLTRKNWGLGLVMYIIAIVILGIVLILGTDTVTLVGVLVAITLLIMFVKKKCFFQSR